MRGSGYPGGDGLDTLLKATGRGEHGAFDLLYQQLSAPAYGLIRAVLRDRAQAEEVTQEVFLEIWQLASRYDASKGTAIAWVMTIARRRAIDRVRSAAATAAREDRNAPVPSRDQVAEDAVQRELLRRGLGRLSRPQREAITLAFYGGYTYPQVASVLGVPLGTVKTRIRDGLAKLRDAMIDDAVAASGLSHAVTSGLGSEAAAAQAPANQLLLSPFMAELAINLSSLNFLFSIPGDECLREEDRDDRPRAGNRQEITKEYDFSEHIDS